MHLRGKTQGKKNPEYLLHHAVAAGQTQRTIQHFDYLDLNNVVSVSRILESPHVYIMMDLDSPSLCVECFCTCNYAVHTYSHLITSKTCSCKVLVINHPTYGNNKYAIEQPLNRNFPLLLCRTELWRSQNKTDGRAVLSGLEQRGAFPYPVT